ncbi:prolyl oligopeptidase family serine peptidase [Kribbella shirazensis]|uniref:Pimeloyl-ACP methyl ester carboxylesterase n=1 Tax=Kribbella shirazensis TaxID=1105143 RepID=A0A7X5VJT8_9ACTN|nr:prolyl oligopeptidase family serine peptidase [Kribbella shirazensis]NIK62161.1 pimeloyl-ACP methyl ester carboxylesterase [Kribbella shirazensis]
MEREYLMAVPDGPVRGVTVLFHPFGFTPEAVLFGEPAGELLIRPLDGALGPAEAAGQIVVAPRSHGRVLSGISLAWQDHLDATWEIVREVCDRFRTDVVVVGGLSMGGQEALVLAAQHADDVAAVWAVNPVVDLARWHDDIRDGRTSDALLGADETIREEVGGAPSELPHEYTRRSPISYAAALAGTAVRLVWSAADTIIPGQPSYHAHALAENLRALGGDVDERIVTHAPISPTEDPGRYAHEACDTWEHLAWASLVQIT